MPIFNKTSWSWGNPKLRGWIAQIVVLCLLFAAVGYLLSNLMSNLEQRHIASGFGFLHREAGFGIGETLLSYSPTDTFARAIGMGLLNTISVSVIGIIFATIFGVLLGIMRLSSIWLLSKLATLYVEIFRNIPLLIQLFFWYALITENLPSTRRALSLGQTVFLSNRGLFLPSLGGIAPKPLVAAVLIFILLVIGLRFWNARRRRFHDKSLSLWKLLSVSAFCLLGLALVASHSTLQVEVPVLSGFNFQGGLALSPELTALLLGLIIYTAAFIAEIVRAGIQSVDKGQWEATQSIGLSRFNALRLVILPQALRAIIPPLTSTYLNLIKNSSLAVAIGYPDLVSIVNTTLTQTGQAIEGILIIMAAYLCISLTLSLLMNWYNKQIALKGA